jgi:hypothetical protein
MEKGDFAMDQNNARRTLRDRDLRARRDAAEGTRALPGKRVIVHVTPLVQALRDRDVGDSVAELLDLCAATARGESERKRQCFACCSAWVPELEPAGTVLIEVLGTDHGVLSLVCERCWTGGDLNDGLLMRALERDFGLSGVSVVHDAVSAD